MRYIVVDLEATCWENMRNTSHMETIEIGAVQLARSFGPILDTFTCFVRPVVEPKLSDFCQRLTSIRQKDVDQAGYFWSAFPRFLEWIGEEPFVLCSWGAYDLNQLRLDCQRHGIPFPSSFKQHVNLKKEFAQLKRVKSCGMAHALELVGIPLEGKHHRALDDARNIANLAMLLLPELETSGILDQ